MRQRAALARAFISHPKALLLDEPFGALDALTRMTLQDALRQLIREAGPTVLLVTHDVDEALFLADRILVFSPRPATVLKEFNLTHHEKTHDLSEFAAMRSEEHTSELQSLMRISYAVFCLKKKKHNQLINIPTHIK